MASSSSGENDLFGLDEAQKNITLGLMSLFQPVVESIDGSVVGVQQSQDALLSQIDLLQEELNKFQGLNGAQDELEKYTHKLAKARKEINSVNNLLSTIQDRVGRLHTNVSRAAKRRQAELVQV
eukprot:m.266511 g.266511  ORF g.266511 m.266511 type:complete len:124 (+) comp19720_c1_seq25:195-566(+)